MYTYAFKILCWLLLGKFIVFQDTKVFGVKQTTKNVPILLKFREGNPLDYLTKFLCLQIPLFGAKTIGRRSPDGPVLSKAEFVEKVRQSNQACHDGDFHTAIVLYNEALAVDPQNCILYSNRSAAYMKIQQYDKALDDAIKARLLNPKWPKVEISFTFTESFVLISYFNVRFY